MELRDRPVSEIMRREIVTISSKETLDLSQDLMNLGRVRHLPVVDDGRLVGIVTHRDLLAASLTNVLDFDPNARRSFLRSVEVGELMTRDVVSIDRNTTLAEAAQLFVRRKIGCLPVVARDGTLIGLVTETDLVSAAFLEGRESETSGTTIDRSKNAGFSDWLADELDDLRRVRDELRVQAHLGKSEMRERWDALDRALEALEGRAERAKRAAEQPLKEIEDDVRKLARDLRDGYRRIRDAI